MLGYNALILESLYIFLQKKYNCYMKSFRCQLFRDNASVHDTYMRSYGGFTILEMLVSTAIILFIGGQVLIGFSHLKESSVLTRAAQEFAFNIRRAQNMSVSVTATKIGMTAQIPNAVGLRLSSAEGDNDRYFFFADQNSNGVYDDPFERIEPNIFLPSNVRITAITGEVPASPGVHIIFYTPEATLLLSNAAGTPIPNFTTITLTGPSGGIQRIRVRMSGQVTVL